MALMHELSLMDDLVTQVTAELAGHRVHVVRLELGTASCASAEALQFCFQICAKDTPLESATLEIIRTEGDALRVNHVEVS